MKKKIIASIFFMGWMAEVPAQDASQMLEQITALESYALTAKKGYQIMEQGIANIGAFKKDEFGLHSVFFESLSTVNPVIKSDPGISEIVLLQNTIVDQMNAALNRWRSSPWLRADESNAIGQVYNYLVTYRMETLKRLQRLTSDHVYKMADGERMQLIGGLKEGSEKELEFVQAFIRKTDWLISQRLEESEQNEKLRKWADLP